MSLLKELLQLVKIQAPTGAEKPVRDWIIKKLVRLVDKQEVDSTGNLLAEKTYGTGDGPTVLLSAHMDSVNGLVKGRKIVYDKNNGTVYSTKGILGADDRAGIAIILNVLRRIPKEFNGKIKIAFSVEEEIGCVGARAISDAWLKGVNLAIVVDRKGSRDIVIGTWGTAFCDLKVGEFFEQLKPEQEWLSVDGGISDAYEFSSRGINSVNLSAGYYNEHTANEYVVIKQCYETADLIVEALKHVNTHYKEWGAVPTKPAKYLQWSSSGVDVAWNQRGGITLYKGTQHMYLTEQEAYDLFDELNYMLYGVVVN